MSARIDQALVLAAGIGSRLRASDRLPKPLTPVAGKPLLERTLLTLAAGGIREAVVVVGFGKELVCSVLGADGELARSGLDVRFVVNERYEQGNGVSVLAAEGAISGPFVLSMADHVYEPALVQRARAADTRAADLHLCVDRRIDQVYDLDDATKVKSEADRIVDIGKTLTDYDCIDCGVFVTSESLMAALRAIYEAKGDCSLSDGVRALAAAGRARTIDIGDAFWQDVDTVEALERAEQLIRGGC